jgi:hypothetical protein
MLLAIAFAFAADPVVHDLSRPVALGSRMGAWAGPYTAPAVGGQIKLRASRWVGLTGFADHTLRVDRGLARHDHVIGFSAYTPRLLGADSWYVSPTVGACVDFRIDSPVGGSRLPANHDVLFGAHGGLTAEVALAPRWSAEVNAQGFAYVGNQQSTTDWTASASPGLHPSAVVQLLGSLNLTL